MGACRSPASRKSILAITSKIVSIAEKRVVSKESISKKDLIIQEADRFICETDHDVLLTLKHGILIASAGIDESNAQEGGYILFPEDPYASAKKLYDFLRERSQIKELGVIVTDSHTTPLRKGVVGVALSHWGFHPTRNLVGEEDLFKKCLRMTSVNVLDALAVSAVLVMGESNESQPLAIVNYPGLDFTDRDTAQEIKISPNEDLYAPLLSKR
ncbi:MAG: coenzyme F420-0:L-glutamate ligase [Bdellovibrionota bacterium]